MTADLGRASEQGRVIVEQFLVENSDHARARAGRHDDVVDILVHIEEPLRKGPRLFPIARIEGGLSAACLVGVEVHVDAVTTEDANCALSDLGEELVDDTGNEERDVLGGSLTHW